MARPGLAERRSCARVNPWWRWLTAVLATVVMVLAVAPPVAAQDDYRLEPVDMGTTDLGSALLTYRSLYPEVSHDRNVAVFEYTRREVTASGESRDIHVWVVTASAGELTNDDVVRFAIFEDGVLVDKVELSLDELLARVEDDDAINTHAERLIYLYLGPEERRQVGRGESEFQPCLLTGRECRLDLAVRRWAAFCWRRTCSSRRPRAS